MFRVDRGMKRIQEQLPFPKFFQEEFFPSVHSPDFQQLPSRSRKKGDTTPGCGHQQHHRVVVADCPIKGSITCCGIINKNKNWEETKNIASRESPPSMGWWPVVAAAPPSRRRRREEKCENRKNYVLRTGCPVWTDLVHNILHAISCRLLLLPCICISSLISRCILLAMVVVVIKRRRRSKVKWLIDFWKSLNEFPFRRLKSHLVRCWTCWTSVLPPAPASPNEKRQRLPFGAN